MASKDILPSPSSLCSHSLNNLHSTNGFAAKYLKDVIITKVVWYMDIKRTTFSTQKTWHKEKTYIFV